MLLWYLILATFHVTVKSLQNNTVTSTTAISIEPEDSFYPSLQWSDVFDWKVLTLLSQKSKNVLFSPASLKLVLVVLYEASSGATKKDFEDSLQFGSKEAIRQSIKEMIEALHVNPTNENRLSLSTKIFLDSEVKIKDVFAQKVRTLYGIDVESTNFSDTQTTSDKINKWASEFTMGEINRLTDPGDVQDMMLLLANAIYFKGVWRHQFLKNATFVSGFYNTPFSKIYIPYMTTTNKFYYFESQLLEAKILRMPYKNSQFSMFFLLPFSKGGLSTLIGKVDVPTLHREMHYMDKKDVLVTIPKFSFKLKASYTDVLRQLGLQKIFQNSASFTGIAEGNNSILRKLVVSDILQSTAIDVDEEGSVAVAVTDVIIGNKIGVPEDVFNATHPFLFFIQDDNTGTVLFLGKVENPLYQELEIRKEKD
ncbi:hypothetical protein ABEB36_011131 [Hypothenemus hampei]|uniref:Serpin domain-containing protein n=1 Tax=Hypothenemus hampei TaxID=57062 RepID=A0ABD1EH34_HYPHA